MVRSRISAESWEARVAAARVDQVVLEAIGARVEAGSSLNEAIAEQVPKSRRSWVIRNWPRFRVDGLEALIDARVPREPKVAKESGPLIEAAREANPKVTANEVLEILRKKGSLGLRVGKAEVVVGA